MPEMERRCKMVQVDADILADMLRPGRRNNAVITIARDGVPDDARLERLHYDFTTNCFQLIFSHPSWDVVAPGYSPPSLLPVFQIERQS